MRFYAPSNLCLILIFVGLGGCISIPDALPKQVRLAQVDMMGRHILALRWLEMQPWIPVARQGMQHPVVDI